MEKGWLGALGVLSWGNSLSAFWYMICEESRSLLAAHESLFVSLQIRGRQAGHDAQTLPQASCLPRAISSGTDPAFRFCPR